MRILRGLAGGFLLALFSLFLVLGSIWLALAEGVVRTRPISILPTPSPLSSPPTFPAFPILASPTPSSTLPVLIPSPSCIPPSGWVPLLVNYGDTLETLAQRFGITIEILSNANCLSSDMLIPGSLIYVPQIPTSTPIPCGPPPGWVQYVVQSGDTLYRLSQAFGVDYRLLQQANCLGNSTLIYAGQRLWVPNIPTRTPIVTDTPIIIVIATTTATLTPTVFPSETPTSLPTVTSTATPSPTPPPTALPSETPTPPSATPSPSASDTPTPTYTSAP